MFSYQIQVEEQRDEAVPLLLTSKSITARVEPWIGLKESLQTHSNKHIYTVQIIILTDIESQRNLVFIALWLSYSPT